MADGVPDCAKCGIIAESIKSLLLRHVIINGVQGDETRTFYVDALIREEQACVLGSNCMMVRETASKTV